MFTSDFTLEVVAPGTLNIPRQPMPPQLRRLGVPESKWTSIHDYASGLADRMAAREAAKRQLDASASKTPQSAGFSSISFSTSRKYQKQQQRVKEIDAQKAEHDENTKTEWSALVNKCNATLSGHGGILARPMVDGADGSEFGIEFRCNAERLRPSKLELRFDPRRGGWTWSRLQLPEELASAGVDSGSWTKVWDEADATLKRVIMLEKKKRNIQKNISRLDCSMSIFGGVAGAHHDTAAVNRVIQELSKLIEEKSNVGREQEVEWRKLLERVDDIMFEHGITAKLMTHDSATNLGYCGLMFRFRPAVPAVAIAI